MIESSATVKNQLKQNTSVSLGYKTLVEYNMNDMVNNISVIVKNKTTQAALTDINIYQIVNNYIPFKNYFPYKSLTSPYRPEFAGIKYGILGDISSPQTDYADPKTTSYRFNYRTYYAGANNKYQYFVSKPNGDLCVALEYGKTVFTNKISIKFEISHGIPVSGDVRIKVGGSYTNIKNFTSSDIAGWSSTTPGVLNLYYNGSSWSTTESNLSTSSYVQITGIQVGVDKFTSGGTSKYIALIDLSPRYVIDISSDILSFNIRRESSLEQEIVPVGALTANSLNLNIVRYANATNSGKLRIVEYDKTNTTFSTAASIIYLYKDAIVSQYISVNNEMLLQGKFYMDSWNVDEFGNTDLLCLDGARILQKITCPEILCKQFSTTAIIRRLLDSIGFPNYKINTNSESTENGITKPVYWWSDNNKSVWEALQEICKDNQIIASFDENNILQFYTRDHFFSTTRKIDVDWAFNYTASGSTQPNLISFSKTKKQAGTELLLDWNPVYNTEKNLVQTRLWTSPSYNLSAFSLEKNLEQNDTHLSYTVLSPYTNKLSVPESYQGYLLVDAEIIEYDAVEYKYTISGTSWETVQVESPSDLSKYLAIAKTPATEYVKPTGRLRIKNRALFNTVKRTHYKSVQVPDMWNQTLVRWG